MAKLVALAANSTKLANKTKNNATKIAEIQAEASAASVKLATMDTNSTLVSTCAVIDAAQATKEDCKKMESLTKLVALASNETKLAEKTQNNATKIADIQAKASTAAARLSDMTSNTTLINACAAITAAKQSTNTG